MRVKCTQDEPLGPRDTLVLVSQRQQNVPHRRTTGRARARANHNDSTRKQTSRHSQPCRARRGDILSRQDDAQTRRGRRTRACAVPKRRRMSRAGGAGGRCAQGEAEGRDRSCCGYRACAVEGAGDSAPLRVRSGRRTSGAPLRLPVLVFHVNSRWYSSQFVELTSLLRATALLSQQGKQRARWWRHGAGHTSFGLSAGRWVHSNLRYGMRLSKHTKCSINWDGYMEEEHLHVPKRSCEGADGRNGSQSVPQKDCGTLLRGSHCFPAMV